MVASVIFNINEVSVQPMLLLGFHEMRCLRLREVKSLVEGHTAREWRNQFPNSHLSGSQASAYIHLYR